MAIEGRQVENRIQKIKTTIEGKLEQYYGRTLENASDEEMFQAVALSIRGMILEQWVKANKEIEKKGLKKLCYLSAEFLMGRALVNNMINLGLLEDYRAVMAKIGYPFEKLEEQENEAALGNGGLGRLAACFLDSLSTLNLPVTGYGIRYEYGVFCQRIVNGEQTEVPDDWTAKGDVWEIERREEQIEVRFDGLADEVWTDDGLAVVHKNYQTVTAVPYDMPVIGYDSRVPATLRLWRAECPAVFDLHSFNKGDFVCMLQQKELAESISKVLYPENDHIAGRMLRLRQYYFLASATMQCMVREHKKRYGDVRTLPEKIVIQINDIASGAGDPGPDAYPARRRRPRVGRGIRHCEPRVQLYKPHGHARSDGGLARAVIQIDAASCLRDYLRNQRPFQPKTPENISGRLGQDSSYVHYRLQ